MIDGDSLIDQAAEWPTLVPELQVSDLDRSVETYQRLFGFELEQSDPPRRAVMRISGAPVVLVQAESRPDADSAVLGQGVTLNIRVEDPKRLYEGLREERYPMAVPMEISEYVRGDERVLRTGFAVQDADGHVLAFSD